MLKKATRVLSVMALGMAVAAPALSTSLAMAQPSTGKDEKVQPASEKDVVIFRNGRTLEGQIVEETPTSIRMKVVIAGIPGETTYDKTDILSITRAAKGDAKPGEKADPKTAAKPEAKPDMTGVKAAKSESSGADTKKVYKIELSGVFGQDISQTPIRQAVKDAQKNNADYLVVVMDNDWSLKRFGGTGDIPDDASAFDELFRSEAIDPIFNEEIPRDWQKQPKVIFWVKKAMGGAAFLPFNCSTIYFSSDGKMGGIGRVEEVLGQMGDLVFREKQFALRLGHAEGKAIKGGYDPRIVDAMARTEYVLSYRMVGGKAELLERMPENADEFLLTDDGKDDRKDDIEALARGEGNDVLTLTADIAYKLGVSKGTVDSFDDLIFQLGLARNYELVKGQSENIMTNWRDGVVNAKRQLPRLWKEYKEVQVKQPGGYTERTQARGKRKSILTEMQNLEKKYEEAIHPHRIPPQGVPDWNELETIKKQIDLEQLGDKPEKKP